MNEVGLFLSGLLAGIVFCLFVFSKRNRKSELKAASLDEQLRYLNEKLEDKEKILEKSDHSLEQLLEEKGKLREQLIETEVRLQEEIRRGRQQFESLREMKKNLKLEFESLAHKILTEKAGEQKNGLESVLDPLMKEIGEFKQKVQNSYEKEAMQRHSLKNEIVNLQKLNHRMSEEAVNLTRALKGDNRKQGAWGEVILESILEASGLRKGHEFSVQKILHSDDGRIFKPDVLVHLPEDKDVIIDSKVSLKAYERYVSETDEVKKEKFGAAHLESVKAHINGLSIKSYEDLPDVRTLDYVLLFMPVEGAFRLALELDPDLFVSAMKNNIMIVSPSTLLVTLRTVNQIWRYENQNQNARAIARQAEVLYKKFILFVKELQKSGQALNNAQKHHESALKRLSTGRNNLVRLSEGLKMMGVEAKDSLPDGLVAPSFAAEELIEFEKDELFQRQV